MFSYLQDSGGDLQCFGRYGRKTSSIMSCGNVNVVCESFASASCTTYVICFATIALLHFGKVLSLLPPGRRSFCSRLRRRRRRWSMIMVVAVLRINGAVTSKWIVKYLFQWYLSLGIIHFSSDGFCRHRGGAIHVNWHFDWHLLIYSEMVEIIWLPNKYCLEIGYSHA